MREEIDELVRGKKIAYLPEDEVRSCGVFKFDDLVAIIKEAYIAHYHGQCRMPHLEYLKYNDRSSYDRIIVLLGWLGGNFDISGMKEICSFPGNGALGFPRASGLIILNDPLTQRPFAIMEGSLISASRTAAVTGCALELLAPQNAATAAFLGCGFQAGVHIDMWSQLYKEKVPEIHVYDRDEEIAHAFASRADECYDIKVTVCDTAQSAVSGADIIVPMTTEEKPYVKAGWIRDGSLYSAVSLLDPELEVITKSHHVIVDDVGLCMHEGRPLQKLDEKGMLDKKILTMGEVLVEKPAIRKSENEKIFFNPMGTVITDLAVAYYIFQNAMESGSIMYLPV